MTDFTLLTVVVLTAIALVTAALLIARLAAPRTFNPQKGEPYECGVPTRGEAWFQFHAGYYLYAILFLIFDIETVFLFPWAAVVGRYRHARAVEHRIFYCSIDSGPGLRWRKGALEWK